MMRATDGSGAARPLALAVLGDSIAYGQGADRPDDAPGPRLAAGLREAGTPVSLAVHAVPGARSIALAAQVRSALAGRAEVALVIIGANDVTHFVPVEQSVSLLGGAVRDLRAAGTQVVVVPAPDLSAVPWVPVPFRPLVRAASEGLRTQQSRIALREGARVAHVDALHDRFAADVGLFSGDRFHPSSRGYALIAQALLPALTAAAADALAARDASA